MTAPRIDDLTADPHPYLAEIRRHGPIGWVSSLGGWVVVGHDLAISVMRDAESFTVDDPRFTTSRVVGPSMLSTDGPNHARHRQPFVAPFTPRASRAYFAEFVVAESARLVAGFASAGEAELRSALAAPLATACMQLALGLRHIPIAELLAWYRDIVAAVAALTAGDDPPASGDRAYSSLAGAIRRQISVGGSDSFLGEIASGAQDLTMTEVVSNTAVLLFGGIETTEGMMANLFHQLLADDALIPALHSDPTLVDAAIEESLRLEPAAAVVDRYATSDISVGGVDIRRGDLVVVSLAGANRDPAVFADPDRFDLHRADVRKQLAFAQGPHTCIGLHLARLQTRCAVSDLLTLPHLTGDPARTTDSVGLVFRKPDAVWARWSTSPPAGPVPRAY